MKEEAGDSMEISMYTSSLAKLNLISSTDFLIS